MEREISIAVEIGVTLIALAAFISILWFTVFMGNDMSNQVSMEATNILATAESGRLQELTTQNTVLPVSAVYSILRSNESVIGSVQCKLSNCGTTGDGSCLLGHLSGKCSLQVVFLEDMGWYELIIHKQNCGWHGGSCTGKKCP